MVPGVGLTGKRVVTNVARVHEPGHPEPWIIALSEAPTVHRAFDYGLRWGIEAMFSDFKTRGFGLEDSHIRLPKRLDHLILVMALALYWAVSTGMWDAVNRPTPVEKSPAPQAPKSCQSPHFLLHERHSAIPTVPSMALADPTALECLAKLTRGEQIDDRSTTDRRRVAGGKPGTGSPGGGGDDRPP